MSMFHELMMRKKEENFLYPVIHGSLTENPEGVFSGFSLSNYLQDSNFFDVANATSFESVIKFTTGSTVAQQQGGAGIGYSYFGFYINSAGNLKAPVTCVKSGSNTSSDPTILTGLSANTTYWVNVVFANGTITWKTSTDGINWNTSTTDTIDSLRLPGSSVFVVGKTSHGVFNGSIDLNNTYYIINGTKYNLQAVVGYTVVGSPTITDGVVSGFSLSNYVKISTSSVDIGTTDFEIQTSFIANSIATTNIRIFATDSSATTVLGFNLVASGNKLRFVYQGTNNYLDSSLSSYEVNVKYYAKFYRKGNILGLEISTDKVNWIKDTKEYSGSLSFGNEFRLGVNVGGGTYFNGSIDLNETYIKINNKLWFNGQQA